MGNSFDPVTLIWASLERFSPPAELESISDAILVNYKGYDVKWNKGQWSSRAVMGGININGLIYCNQLLDFK